MIFIVEKYYSPEQTLKTKLSDEKFQAYLELFPELLQSSAKASARNEVGNEENQEEKPAEDGAPADE